MEEEDFPPRRKLGPRTIGWYSNEIETWLLNRVAQDGH
jgi:predicted DNA-binding transcriptional regulator AlpA